MNVVPLPVGNLRDIASMARTFADELDAGNFGKARSVVLILDTDEEVHTLHWGECVNIHQAIGIIETGKHHLLNTLLD